MPSFPIKSRTFPSVPKREQIKLIQPIKALKLWNRKIKMKIENGQKITVAVTSETVKSRASGHSSGSAISAGH